jgi:hypothetical protein
MATAEYTAAAAQMIDVREAVREYRSQQTALRRLAKSRPVRNVGATERAIARRTDRLRTIELSLLLADQRLLIGELTEEAKLVTRINDRTPTVGRRDLKDRLAATRRTIKLLTV